MTQIWATTSSDDERAKITSAHYHRHTRKAFIDSIGRDITIDIK
jgi:hypothetical protein